MAAAVLLPRMESSTCLAKMLFTVTALVSEAKQSKIFVPLVKSDCVFTVCIFFNISPSNPQAK